MNETWFVSDWHFNHVNIIKYCDRPFKNVEEMNETIIERHNERVAENDTVFVLGDVCFGDRVGAVSLVERLNGHKILIKGNHDWRMAKKGVATISGFSEVYKKFILTSLPRTVVMAHIPNAALNLAMRIEGERPIVLCGHQHNLARFIRSSASQLFAINVGVDVTEYYPLSYTDIDTMDKVYEVNYSEHH
jgi:calcineurin-like phosphoesterase family protein